MLGRINMEISREADTLRALYQNWTDQMVENPDLTIANLRSMSEELRLSGPYQPGQIPRV
jgi:hypothetical protein